MFYPAAQLIKLAQWHSFGEQCGKKYITFTRDGRISGSGRISTIRQNPTPTELHVLRRIGLMLITASTSVRQSTKCSLSIVWLMLSPQSVRFWSQPSNDPHLALMYV